MIKKKIFYFTLIAIVTIYSSYLYKQYTDYSICKTNNIKILNEKCFTNLSSFSLQEKYNIFYNALKKNQIYKNIYIDKDNVQFLLNYRIVHINCKNDEKNCELFSDSNNLLKDSLKNCIEQNNSKCIDAFLNSLNQQIIFMDFAEEKNILKKSIFCNKEDYSLGDWQEEYKKICIKQ